MRLAHELWLIGDLDGALAKLDDAQRESVRLGVRECEAAIRHERAEIARHNGQLDEALRLLNETAMVVNTTHTPPQLQAVIATSLGCLAAARGDLDAAQAHHDAALAYAFTSTDAPIVGHVLVGLAHMALHRGDPRQTAILLGAASGVRGDRDQSLIDLPLVERAALAALGEEEFTKAHQHGLTHTTVDDARKFAPAAVLSAASGGIAG